MTTLTDLDHAAYVGVDVVQRELGVPAPPIGWSRFRTGLDGQSALAYVGPNWFATVMGTGIVANAAATLPVGSPVVASGLLGFARGVWVLDVLLLAVVLTVTALHWVRHPEVARSHLDSPTMAHFYGAPAMALMTVGAGAVLVGQPVIGSTAAIGFDAVLWSAGTLLGLWTAVMVPLKMFTTHQVGSDSAFGGWLMPVVPPMVSAATGPLLIPHLPAGQWQLTLQVACYAMFGLALLASLVVIALIWGRLVRHGVGAAAAVPTLWIVLGPLGQSITAAYTLGVTAPNALPRPYGDAFAALGPVYGLPVWGFAMLWLALAVSITVRTARSPGGLPFTLTWWSFTFPVGTVVTGTSGLAITTGAHAFSVLAVVLYTGLVVAWAVVATRTVRGITAGRLLVAPVGWAGPR
ncbi:TDT family transporter [Nocardioides salsibiostraticola]